MADRIPFKIYRLRSQDSTEDLENRVSPSLEAWQYIVGKTEQDIDTSRANDSANIAGYITLTIDNFLPGTDIPETSLINPLPVKVLKDSSTSSSTTEGQTNASTSSPSDKLVVYIDGSPYYIRRTQVDEQQLNPVPDVFEFYVNPQRISFNKEKLISEVRTRGGWDVQHWGEKLTVITVEGITGGLHRDTARAYEPGKQGQSLKKGESIEKSTAWQKLRILSAMYDADHGKTPDKMLYRLGFAIYEDFYIGYFSNFVGPEIVADRPYLMTFNFTFKVEEKISDYKLRLEYQRLDNINPVEVSPPPTGVLA